MIEENLDRIKKNIIKAAGRAGADAGQVRLVVVTKTVGPDEILQAAACGVKDIGESRVQTASVKKKLLAGQLSPDVCWHMIGHLQTNKVRQAVEIFDMIHSVDSLQLAREIDKRAGQIDKVMPVLLEVNVAGENSKFGLNPEELIEFAGQTSILSKVKVQGLMTMAPLADNPETARPVFKRLKELSGAVKQRNIPGIEMKFLSMGMSRDYEVAIEEGANMVRIGSAVFNA